MTAEIPTPEDPQAARIEYLERTLFAIREAVAKWTEDDGGRAIRVITQKVDWALEGKESPREAILESLAGEDRGIGQAQDGRPPVFGFNLSVTVPVACTIRLNVVPVEEDEDLQHQPMRRHGQ